MSWFDIKYYLYEKPRDFFYNLKWYFKNIHTFRKQLWNWRNWDSAYQIDLFKFGIEQLKDCISNGNEEMVSRIKKVRAMQELIDELNRDLEDEIVYMQGKETIEQYSDRFEMARIERDKKIYRLISGQTMSELKSKVDKGMTWDEARDGTGITGWWD